MGANSKGCSLGSCSPIPLLSLPLEASSLLSLYDLLIVNISFKHSHLSHDLRANLLALGILLC